MANEAQLKFLRQGVIPAWNAWRETGPVAPADLAGANLEGANLAVANLIQANLAGACLAWAKLFGAYLPRRLRSSL